MQIIERPIGMNDIKRKIQSSRYRNRGEYERDFDTLFQNAVDYNKEGSAVARYALRMKEAFHKVVKDLPFSESVISRRQQQAKEEAEDEEEDEDEDEDEDGDDDDYEPAGGDEQGAANTVTISLTVDASAAQS